MIGTLSRLPCLLQLLDQFTLRGRLDFNLDDATKYKDGVAKKGPEYHISALSDRSVVLPKLD